MAGSPAEYFRSADQESARVASALRKAGGNPAPYGPAFTRQPATPVPRPRGAHGGVEMQPAPRTGPGLPGREPYPPVAVDQGYQGLGQGGGQTARRTLCPLAEPVQTVRPGSARMPVRRPTGEAGWPDQSDRCLPDRE